MSDPWSQSGFRVRLEWGPRGAEAAAARGDILVIVDVLRFSTTVAAAVSRDALIYPCDWDDDPSALARRLDASAAVRTAAGPRDFTLSPHSFAAAGPGTRVVLSSPNGAVCSGCSDRAAHVFAGALVNASAVARAVNAVLDGASIDVTVVACGERSPDDPNGGALRFAIEDYLGAGAIVSGLNFEKSPEAQLCEGAFLAARSRLEVLVHECGSGRELRQTGRGADVECACRLDTIGIAPVLREGWFRAS